MQIEVKTLNIFQLKNSNRVEFEGQFLSRQEFKGHIKCAIFRNSLHMCMCIHVYA